MDARAREMLLNYSTAAGWYRPATVVPRAQATNDYVIITTNAIETAYATALTGFTGYLTSKGFTPLIVTEDDFGGLTGQSPDGTAEKIASGSLTTTSRWASGTSCSSAIRIPPRGDPDEDVLAAA